MATTENGEELSVATRVAPSKKLTLAIVPSASVALAERVVAPAGNTAPFAGAVSEIDGAVLELKLNVLSVVAPSLSVARANTVCAPGAKEVESV